MVEILWSTQNREERLATQAHLDLHQKQPAEDPVRGAVRRHTADYHNLHRYGGTAEGTDGPGFHSHPNV